MRHRGAPEIGVRNDSRCVDDGNEKAGGDVSGYLVRTSRIAAGNRFARGIDEEWMRQSGVRE